MTRYYHSRFFADIRYTAFAVLVLLVVGFGPVPEAFLLIPIVALIGANQTAFDASYLFMARTYARALEEDINSSMRRRVLVGSDLEERYLVPLRSRRYVGVSLGQDFTWFGWMTVLYTSLGIVAFIAGLWLGWPFLGGFGGWVYLVTLGTLSVGSVITGWWWFVSGAGQDRLDAVIATRFESANNGVRQ